MMPPPHAFPGHGTCYSTSMPSSLTPSPSMNRSVFNYRQEDSISIQGIVTMGEEPTDIEHLNTKIVQARLRMPCPIQRCHSIFSRIV